ncbi:hypothetical protein B0H17DRAFT_1200339 [Mycena rosella]|uniref:Uncharacterized protein n=1 Tax=Mycena rosella TaxID=1033263 RepID=A0AAD7DIV0_MYCRO|nr:hypothetical protein B0H17DRAFT_1200339 [Mycena rosella]
MSTDRRAGDWISASASILDNAGARGNRALQGLLDVSSGRAINETGDSFPDDVIRPSARAAQPLYDNHRRDSLKTRRDVEGAAASFFIQCYPAALHPVTRSFVLDDLIALHPVRLRLHHRLTHRVIPHPGLRLPPPQRTRALGVDEWCAAAESPEMDAL